MPLSTADLLALADPSDAEIRLFVSAHGGASPACSMLFDVAQAVEVDVDVGDHARERQVHRIIGLIDRIGRLYPTR